MSAAAASEAARTVGGDRQEVEQRVVGVAQGQRPYAVREPPGEVGVGEDQAAAGLADEVREVVAGQVLVDRYVHEARAGAGEEADQVGVGVVAVGADPVAGRQARAEQDARRAGDGGVECVVRPGAFAVLDGDARRGAAGAASQESVNRAGVPGVMEDDPRFTGRGGRGTGRVGTRPRGRSDSRPGPVRMSAVTLNHPFPQ
ncbi:hypothetical protein SHIRM173S_05560 [Streptomyces hirsutus]